MAAASPQISVYTANSSKLHDPYTSLLTKATRIRLILLQRASLLQIQIILHLCIWCSLTEWRETWSVHPRATLAITLRSKMKQNDWEVVACHFRCAKTVERGRFSP